MWSPVPWDDIEEFLEVVIYVALLKPCVESILGLLNLKNIRCSE